MQRITYQSGYNFKTGEYNDSLAGDYLWSSVNTREASPDVMTPFTWSLLRLSFEQMIMLPGYLGVGNIGGRIYNNVSVGVTALHALTMGMKTFNATNNELYGVDASEIEEWDVPLIPIGIRDRFLVLRNTIRLLNNVRKTVAGMEAQLHNNSAWCESEHRRLPTLGKEELVHWVKEILSPHIVTGFWWMVGSASAQANVVSKLRGELMNLVGTEDTIALLSNVSSKDDFLASLGPVAGLDRVLRGTMSREEYIWQYGHRGPHEVELSYPRPAENPDWIDEQLDSINQAPVDVDELLSEQHARYESALQHLQTSQPKRFISFKKRIKEAARLTRLRERGRSETTRAIWVARAFALRAGELSGLGEDTFFLEFEEINQLLVGRNEVTKQIPVRKAAYKKNTELPQYPTIILGPFNPVEWAADPNRPKDIFDSTNRIKKRFADEIKGLPGSAGQADGRVRIVNSPEEGNQLQHGEILVAVTTNVGWTPIFPRAAAVITDVGAPLSHAAIVARELGIPAVVGCFNATSVLKTGDRVRVDGGQGTVEIIERAK